MTHTGIILGFLQYRFLPQHCVCMCDNNDVPRCVSAADRDCAVGRDALQLCPSQRGAVALVSVRGSWRAPLGAGKQLFSLLSQTLLS